MAALSAAILFLGFRHNRRQL